MLSRVVVQSENPLYLELENARPDDSIIVDKIDGLDPPDIDLFLGDYARDGGYYNGRRVAKRNPVFYLTINPKHSENETVSDIRERLYRAFIDPRAAGDDVRIDLFDDVKPPRYISGYSEKIESPIFAKETELTVSMVCPNPYIYNVDETIVNSNGPTVPFEYAGSAETGFEILGQFTGATNIMNLTKSVFGSVFNSQALSLTYPPGFLSGDVIYINTRRGERAVRMYRGATITNLNAPTMTDVISDGTEYNLLYALSPTSEWLDLHRPPATSTNPNSQLRLQAVTANLNIKQIRSRGAWWGI